MNRKRAAPGTVLVVIPALNEAASVGSVVKEVQVAVESAHVLVVDDGSTDDTRSVAAGAGAEVLSLPFNLGVGGALRAGFRYAVRFGYDTVVQVDADGQHDPADIPRLLDRLQDADLVIGARFAGEGDYAVSGSRRLAIRLLAWSLSRRTHTALTDTTSGFRAFSHRAINIFAQDYPAEYLGDTVEALVIAAGAGCVITQVPVRMRPRTAGTPSQSSWRAAVYLVRAALAVAISGLSPRRSTR